MSRGCEGGSRSTCWQASEEGVILSKLKPYRPNKSLLGDVICSVVIDLNPKDPIPYA